MSDERTRRAELSLFLRTRRQRVSPEEAGVPVLARRRTTGLRREDVAQLAGVSFKWYTLFESGAASGVSRRVVDAVSTALRLTQAEKRHLLNLLDSSGVRGHDPAPHLLAGFNRVVDEIVGWPAVVYSSIFDVLHYNRAYDALFGQSRRPEGVASNKIWRVFNDPAYRAIWHDWERLARSVTAELRYLNSANPESPDYLRLLDELAAAPEFARFWSAGDVDVLGDRTGRFDLDVPDVGLMSFDIVSMLPPGPQTFLFVSMLPADPATRRGLERVILAGALRP